MPVGLPSVQGAPIWLPVVAPTWYPVACVWSEYWAMLVFLAACYVLFDVDIVWPGNPVIKVPRLFFSRRPLLHLPDK